MTYPASPAETTQIEWQGGNPDALGRRDWRALPLDRLSARGAPFAIRAILGSDVREVRISVVPDLAGVERSRAHGIEGFHTDAEPLPSGAAWIRAVLSPPTEEAFRYLE